MNEEEFRQIAQEELSKQIMENLNSGIIFKYINTLEERNKDLEQIEQEHKEENGRLRDRVKELEKSILLESKPTILGTIPISELKEIVDECIPKKENMITKELEYTPNANANSYLTQRILDLLDNKTS